MERLHPNIQTFRQSNSPPKINIGAGSFSVRPFCFYILASCRNILSGFFYILVSVNYIGTPVNNILASSNYILAFVIYIGAFETYILAFVNYIPSSATYILHLWLNKQMRKPTAKENAHFVFCPILSQRKNKKSISLPSFCQR